MPMYNAIDYIDSHSDKSGSLWQFKRDQVPVNNDDLTNTNSRPFKYKLALVKDITDTVANKNSSVENI